ncbi:MAG: hypothetical protein KC517_09280 [Bacteroidetes bacterium]|nr:hypothetical protein [Bacteroidota bacterium]
MELLVFVKHRWADFNGNWKEQNENRQKGLAAYLVGKKAVLLQDRLYHTARYNEGFEGKRKERDIVEEHEDGWWAWVNETNPDNKMKESYAVIGVPGVPEKKYGGPLKSESGKVLYKFRYYASKNLFAGSFTVEPLAVVKDKKVQQLKQTSELIK